MAGLGQDREEDDLHKIEAGEEPRISRTSEAAENGIQEETEVPFATIGRTSTRRESVMLNGSNNSFTDAKHSHRASFELQRAKQKLERMSRYHAQDFDTRDSDLDIETSAGRLMSDHRIRERVAWFLAAATGLLMGIVGFLTEIGIDALEHAKLSAIQSAIRTSNQSFALPLAVQLAFAIGFAGFATILCTFVEPASAGSGVAEVKLFLNGVVIDRLLNISTLVVKMAGLIPSIASGIIAGQEGPFVHGGAIMGSLVARFGSYRFTDESSHKDYVAIGSAAGVATAFGSPIGGLLFMVEESISFHSTKTLWKAFLSTSCAVFITKLLLNLYEHGRSSYSHDMGLSRFFGLYPDDIALYALSYRYYYWEMPLFLLLGFIGAAIGVLFVHMVGVVDRLRALLVRSIRWRRAAEVIVVIAVTNIVLALIAFYSRCRQRPTDQLEEQYEGELFQRLWCDEGEYSQTGSLVLGSLKKAAQGILHLGQRSGTSFEVYPTSAALFGAIAFVLMAATAGTAIPHGIFVPSIFVGSVIGRLGAIGIREIMNRFNAPESALPSEQTWATVGAASAMAGITRMALSTAVLIMETTGSLQLIIPIMLVVFTAKFTGDNFGPGFVEKRIEQLGAPILEEPDLSLENTIAGEKALLSELMTPAHRFSCLSPRPYLRDVLTALRHFKHEAFPITANGESGETVLLLGLVRYRDLMRMLQHRVGISHDNCKSDNHLPGTQLERERIRAILDPITHPADSRSIDELEAMYSEDEKYHCYLNLGAPILSIS